MDKIAIRIHSLKGDFNSGCELDSLSLEVPSGIILGPKNLMRGRSEEGLQFPSYRQELTK